MVIDFVMVTAPNPPGSSTLISPPAAVLLIAPAKVLQGAVRLQGLASSPTPETQVRVACAEAVAGSARTARESTRHVRGTERRSRDMRREYPCGRPSTTRRAASGRKG